MKTQKLSAGRIKNLFDVISKNFPTEAPGGIALDVGMLTSVLRDKAKTIGVAEGKLMDKYCARDTDNKPIEVRTTGEGESQRIVEQSEEGYESAKPIQGSKFVAVDKLAEYQAELDEMLNREYDVETVEISAKELRALPKLSAAVAEALLPFVSYASEK